MSPGQDSGSGAPAGRLPLLACLLALAVLLAVPAGAAAASKWTERQLPAKALEGGGLDQVPLYAVSCPSESLCVAVGALDTVAFSQSPTGGRDSWHLGYPTFAEPERGCLEEEGVPAASCSFPGGALDGVSCAGERLCVAVGYEGAVYMTTDPTAGAAAWTIGDLEQPGSAPHLTAVSCPAVSLCVAVSGGNGSASGRVLTSTDPAAGQWQQAELGGAPDLRAVSCATPVRCVAVAKGGRIFVSTDPAGGASAWREVGSPTARDLEGVSCVEAILCAVGGGGGNILSSSDPTGGGGFSLTNADGSVQLTDLSCPTTSRCVAVDNNADVLTSTDPTGGAGAWSFENLVPFEAEPSDHGQFVKNALWGVSCPSAALCVLVGANSRVFTATEPFAAPAPAPAGGRGQGGGRAGRKRPRTHLVFAEHFWKGSVAHHGRARAKFRFYSRDGARGFECKRDRGGWRRCRSPLRYWVPAGRHALRVRAIGRTGLRGPVASLRFRVLDPPRR